MVNGEDTVCLQVVVDCKLFSNAVQLTHGVASSQKRAVIARNAYGEEYSA